MGPIPAGWSTIGHVPVAAGTRIGPYEILAPLGAGGMGEVYRARDHKLDRDVALKVLSPRLADHPGALARFEREAKAVAALSHPNILAIHDFGVIDGTAFAIMELLDGETLRARLDRGPLPPAQAIAWLGQVAEGVAAAHERGIVHRDLKPSNIMVTRGGRLTILDFGVARIEPLPDLDQATMSRLSGETSPGVALGTAGYMAPEQVRGETVDHRADIFALGAILYEMLTGRRAFRGVNAVETMAAILRDEPAPLEVTGGSVPPALERLVHHCLEKDPARRFQSARDLAFHLATLAEGSTRARRLLRASPGDRRRWLRRGAAVAAAGVVALAFWLGTRTGGAGRHDQQGVSFQTVSFGRGIIDAARFTPDGQSVVYGAAWDGEPFRLRLTRPGSPETTNLELPAADLLAVSDDGELAIALDYSLTGWMGRGVLARVSMLGTAPRSLAADVLAADWAPGGSGLAAVSWTAAGKRLEYPLGTVRAETGGWFSHPRLSPDGARLAYLDHPIDGDDRGTVVVLDLVHGTSRTLGREWSGIQGLAWSPGAPPELLFSAYDGATPQSVYAVDLAGTTRQLLTGPTGLFLQDVAGDGRLLVASQTRTITVLARLPGDDRPRDLSWLDYSLAVDVSADGRTVLLECTGDSCGTSYTVLVRSVDGTPAVRLGEGSARELSPDGRYAAALVYGAESRPRLVLYPLGAGQPRTVEVGDLTVESVGWLPDSGGLVLLGSRPGRATGAFVADLEDGTIQPVAGEGFAAARRVPVSPDGRFAVLEPPSGGLSLVPLDGGESRPIAGVEPGDEAVRFSPDGAALYLSRHEVPLRVDRLDLATGERETVGELPVLDPAGLQSAFTGALVSADGRVMVGTYQRRLNKLYVVSGVE